MKFNFKYTFPLFLILCGSLSLSCNRQSPEEKLAHLNGYWEITEVEMDNGAVKEYSISTTIDYIEIHNNEGFRKKVAPNLSGGFTVTDDAEKIIVKIENDSLNLYYSTLFDSWKETVLKANEMELEILNSDKKRFKYKRFEKFNFE